MSEDKTITLEDYQKSRDRCEFLAKANLDLQRQIIALNDRFIEVCKDKIKLIDEKKLLEKNLSEINKRINERIELYKEQLKGNLKIVSLKLGFWPEIDHDDEWVKKGLISEKDDALIFTISKMNEGMEITVPLSDEEVAKIRKEIKKELGF